MNKYFTCVVFYLFTISIGCDGFVPSFGPLEKTDWWEHTLLYQIYPRSFKDSDGDGIGDINGITSKLQYLKDTGIGATWLSPIFQSPMVDFGYDISDFTAIHSEYGTMEDFDRMIVEAKRLDIKILLDFVPNHSSDQCEWFKKSIKREDGYENYYVWHDGLINPDGGPRLPPNNWVSVFYGSAWTWNEERQQFYLHQFTYQQPDLNFMEPKVVKEMNNILTFWLNKGVDGFRVDAVNHMFEDQEFKDEPLSKQTSDSNDYTYLDHIYTKDSLLNYDMIFKWRRLLDDWKKNNGGHTKIMLTEAYANITFTMKFYESDDGTKMGSHLPFNFLLITDLNDKSNAHDVVFTINKWLNYMPLGKTANWVLGNHDNSRVGTRYGPERIDAMNMLIQTLPGVGVTYNGDEIGMLDNQDITWEQTGDPRALNGNQEDLKVNSRDPERTPFQWDNSKNAGFSTGDKTWLPVNSNYPTLNLESQKAATKSHYKLYKQLAELRKHNAFVRGSYRSLAFNQNVFGYVREISNVESFAIVINLGNTNEFVNLKHFDTLSDTLTVTITGTNSYHNIGDELDVNRIPLGPYESLVLKSTISDKRFIEYSETNN